MVVGHNEYDMYLSDEDIIYTCDGRIDYEKRESIQLILWRP